MRIFRWLIFTAAVLLAAGIFMFSSQPKDASNAVSKAVATKIVQIYQQIAGNADTERIYEMAEDIHGFTRKYAHFALYAVLGLLTGLLLMVGNKKSNLLAGLFAWILCIAYAVSDEYHQTFVAGRSGELRDVLIDSVGAFLGIAAVIVICRCVESRKKNRN